MKHTPSLLDKIAVSATAFVFTLSLGYGAGEVIVAAGEGESLNAYILRSGSSSSASSRSSVRKRTVRRVKRSAIVKPSTRRRQSGSTLISSRSRSSNVPIKASCGDKLLIADLGEQCDDGNALDGDGCSAACKIESGFTCAGRPSLCVARCGDGIVTPTEKCDDGDLDGGDGCSAACKIEFGYVCSGTPSSCEPTPYCGDGVKASTEQCDDGNGSPGDGCYACKTE